MMSNIIRVLLLASASMVLMTACGDEKSEQPSDKTHDKTKDETQEIIPPLGGKGDLGDATFGLFSAAYEANKDKKAEVDTINSLLKKVKIIKAQEGKVYKSNKAREDAIDALKLKDVAGITVAQIKQAMKDDADIDEVRPPFACAQGLLKADNTSGALCARLEAIYLAHEAKETTLNSIMTRLAAANNQGFTTNKQRMKHLEQDKVLENLIDTLDVHDFTLNAIQTEMQADRPLTVPRGLRTQADLNLGAQVYGLISGALNDTDTNVRAVDDLLGDISGVFQNPAHTTKEARDTAVDAIANLNNKIAALNDTRAAADRVSPAKIKAALQRDKALLKEKGALGQATYDLFTAAANTAYANAATRYETVEKLNTILGLITPIYVDAGNRFRTVADRLTALRTPTIADPIADLADGTVTVDTISAAMQTNKALTETLQNNPFDPKTATFNLFLIQASNAPAAKMTALNKLLTKLVRTYNNDFNQLKQNRDACIMNDARCPAADKVDPASFVGTNITPAQIVDTMQIDKPLIVSLRASGLAHNDIYQAIINPARRGARTNADINTILENIDVIIKTHPEPDTRGPNARNTAILGAVGGDIPYATDIQTAVTLKYPAININTLFVGTQLKDVFNNALRAPGAKPTAIKTLANAVKDIYKDGTGTLIAYSSRSKRALAVDGIAANLFTDAGITPNAIKTAWNNDHGIANLYSLMSADIRATVDGQNTYNTIVNSAVTDEQKELLLESILLRTDPANPAVARIRPRVLATRNTAVESEVKLALGIAPATALIGDPATLAGSIKANLDTWQPASRAGDVLPVNAAAARLPLNVFDAIVKSVDPNDLSRPDNASMNLMITAVDTNVINTIMHGRAQPATQAAWEGIVDAVAAPASLKVDTKAALLAPNSGMVALAPLPGGGLNVNVTNAVTTGAGLNNQLTNLEKNAFLAAAAGVVNAAPPIAANRRLIMITTALKNAGLRVDTVDATAIARNKPLIRQLISTFLVHHRTESAKGGALVDVRTLNDNGLLRKYKVQKNILGTLKLYKVTIGKNTLGTAPYDLPDLARAQGIPLEAGDFVWMYGTDTSGPKAGEIISGWEPHP